MLDYRNFNFVLEFKPRKNFNPVPFFVGGLVIFFFLIFFQVGNFTSLVWLIVKNVPPVNFLQKTLKIKPVTIAPLAGTQAKVKKFRNLDKKWK